MSQLLVSVRSVDEATEAIAGGADVIDVKEPSRGSLGMADGPVISEIVSEVARERPISVALGELLDLAGTNWAAGIDFASLRYLKVGLAGCGALNPAEVGRRVQLLASAAPVEASPLQWVAVAFADWRRAESPRPERVIEMALSAQPFWGAFLIDTWKKDGSTLRDWIPIDALDRAVRELRAAGTVVAFAGSLGHDEIRPLLALKPDLIAVRGAACAGRDRNAGVDRAAVCELAALLRSAEDSCVRPSPKL